MVKSVAWDWWCSVTFPVYQSDYTAGNGGETFLSPGQSSGSASRLGQSYYNNGSVRGTARSGRGLGLTFRSSGWHRGIHYHLFLLLGFHNSFLPFCLDRFVQNQGVFCGLVTFRLHVRLEWLLLRVVVKVNTNLYSSGRSYVPQTHFRDPVFYADRVSKCPSTFC